MRLLAFVLGPVYLTAESVVDRFSSCSMRETMEINSLQSRNPYLFGVCLNSSLIVDALRSRNPSLIGWIQFISGLGIHLSISLSGRAADGFACLSYSLVHIFKSFMTCLSVILFAPTSRLYWLIMK